MQPGTIHFVAGICAAGKSTLSHPLLAHLPGHVSFDWDLIIPGISMACQSDLHTHAPAWPVHLTRCRTAHILTNRPKEECTTMRQEEITALFDKQASSYDQQWSKMALINGALHLLAATVLAELPPQAHILCVGVGTGAEILYLAQKFPEWHFTAVEPSTAMLDVFRCRAEEDGISPRCTFHSGYLDTLPSNRSFDAATSFLVSQFILARDARSAFFQSIAECLGPGGLLVSSDLAGDLAAPDFHDLLGLWFRVMTNSGALPSPEAIGRMREAYSRDVAVLPPQAVRDIITRGGFDPPVHFFQAGMIHAWYARRSPSQAR